ncbi:MAG: hypothetical protein A2Z91_07125 [Deltaproteobacteria bacterium GWA2_38_16]|nr:MAG: hypothetical protein A2Z91_07125 [Deltaproteobacteria bacterium GWA2_38_16]
MEKTNSEITDFEKRERLNFIAKNVIDCFNFVPDKESLLFITDGKVVEQNPMFVQAINDELEQRTNKDQHTRGNFERIIVKASPKSAEPFGEKIGEKMKDRPVLIVTSMSRSHSQETGAALRADIRDKTVFDEILSSEELLQTASKGWSGFTPERLASLGGKMPDSTYEKMKAFAKVRRIRLISITKGHNPYEILTKGAVEESVEVLRRRAEIVSKLMRDVTKVHITSGLGTDLWLSPRTDKTEVEDGLVDKPGKLSNFPIGEWSTSPFIEGANGLMVVDGPIGGNHNLDMIEDYGPITLVVKEGNITHVNNIPLKENTGNSLAESVKSYLGSGNNAEGHAFRIAELGIGINGKACQSKAPKDIGSSEGEKIYGTCHIAFGSNGSFGVEPGDPNLNAVPIHCDMVLMNGLNVDCERKDGTNFSLIHESEPQGY